MSEDRPEPASTTPDGGPRQLRVRRAPRYPVFLLTGGVVGVLVGLVAGLSGPLSPSPAPGPGRAALVGYLGLGLGLLGALAGGVVAVVLDRGRR